MSNFSERGLQLSLLLSQVAEALEEDKKFALASKVERIKAELLTLLAEPDLTLLAS